MIIAANAFGDLRLAGNDTFTRMGRSNVADTIVFALHNRFQPNAPGKSIVFYNRKRVEIKWPHCVGCIVKDAPVSGY